MTSDYLVEQLQLLPHPEGGYYRETYRCEEEMCATNFEGERNICTAIYFLLEKENVSHFHKIKSDELWFFHEGNALEVVILDESGVRTVILGKNIGAGESYQAVVPAGSWFGARMKENEGYALVSCTVAPGFDFKDFELAKRSELIKEYPQYESLIRQMTLE